MSTLEDDLTTHLRERAARAELRFDLPDVRLDARPIPRARPRGTARARVAGAVAAAVAVAAVVAVAVVVAGDDATDVVAGPTASQPRSNVVELTIAPDQQSRPERLDAGAAVLMAERVGRIEVGPPGELLLLDLNLPSAVDAGCVATETGHACEFVTEEGVVSTASSAAGGPASAGRLRAGGPFAFVEGKGATAVVVTGLDPTVATVEVAMEVATYRQVPALGTVAVPFEPSVERVIIRGIDRDGQVLWGEHLDIPWNLPLVDGEPPTPTIDRPGTDTAPTG